MDFIERLFGIAPDGGNGRLEFSLFFTGVVVAWQVIRRLITRRRLSGRARAVGSTTRG